MNKVFVLPSRQIHLDFHTGPAVPDVGRDFDARAFARRMKAAHVNSVTVFAKCHHGHLYYNTQRPERHPGLAKGLNLLGEQVEALHREGIRAPIYISVLCDECAANTHPEWVARHPDSTQVKRATSPEKVFAPGWQILDMSTPYQEFLVDQTAEVLRLFKPVDGIFFDMCWDQPSTTSCFMDAMRHAGLNPKSESDRAKYAHTLAHQYMARLHGMVKKSNPRASVYFNARPLFNLPEEVQWQEQVEIEALPTGGWGYLYFPKNVRFARRMGKPYLGMTGRFHKSWADFGGLKPYAALEYETSQMMAHGAQCSIGDQLHPRGVLDQGAYELIGRVYAGVEAREPWLSGARPLSQIGLFQVPTGVQNTTKTISGTDEGATRMLTQLRQQFDVVHPSSNWTGYDLLVLPDAITVDRELAGRLRDYLRNGGAILASGNSGLSEDGKRSMLPELGIKPAGMSPFTTTYIRFGKEIAQDVPPSDHVMYEPGVRVTAMRGTSAVAKVVEPYFERAWDHFCSHAQTPGDRVSRWAAAVLSKRARTAYIAYPIFGAFANHGNYPYRLLVRNLLERLLPQPLVHVCGPTGLEATVMEQPAAPARAARTIVHLLYYTAERRTRTLDIIEDIVPLYEVPLSLKLAREPARVYLAPTPGRNAPIDCEYVNGRANLRVPVIRGHQMVVFEQG